MAAPLTTIAYQKTPGYPTQVTLAPQEALPNASQTVVLIGAMGPTGGPTGGGTASGTQVPYTVVPIVNVGSTTAASAEVVTKFGNGSEIAKMVLAAVTVNAAGSIFPPLVCIALPQGATSFGGGSNNQALNVLDKIEAEFVATQFDGNTDPTNQAALLAECSAMSGPSRTTNGQYGTIGVMANTTTLNVTSLVSPNTQFLALFWLPDSSGNPYSVGELAAACAAGMASNPVPFPPLTAIPIPGVTAPANQNDWVSVGAGLESEAALDLGWSPLRVLVNGQVAYVRTVTTLISINGVQALAYFDVQDWQRLYYFRKTVAARVAQPDFANAMASVNTAQNLLAEIIRLADAFEDEGMFQNVAQIAPMIQVARDATDRGRFDVYIPVNVTPGLSVIASNIQGTTLFDSFSI